MAAAYIPDRAGNDDLFGVSTRLLIALQRAGALGGWTPPLAGTDLAASVGISAKQARVMLARLASRGYISRRQASLPRGGRGWRYRVNIERTAGSGVQAD